MKTYRIAIALIIIAAKTTLTSSQGCTPLPDFQNGTITYDEEELDIYPIGTAASYICDRRNNLILVGNIIRRCLFSPSTGFVWSDSEPTCDLKYCVDRILPNGTITYDLPRFNVSNEGYPEGTIAQHDCNPGFRLTGLARSVCTERVEGDVVVDFIWTNDEPVCTPQCPPLSANTLRGILDINFPNDRVAGSAAVHVCFDGYVPTTSLNRTCRENRTWGPPEVNCDPVCSNLASIANGTIVYSPASIPRLNGTIATYTCDAGFLLNGTDMRVCEKVLSELGPFFAAVWNSEAPRCEPTCPEIIPGVGIENIVYSDLSRAIDSIATHTCLPGYTPSGDLIRTCVRGINLETAEWSLPEETCRQVCPDLPDLVNGRITFIPDEMPREIGTVASYTCNEGFRYDGGDVTRQCIEQSSMEVIWDGMAGMCVRQCPALNPLVNGNISYSLDPNPDYDENTTATHECDEGFTLVGAEDRICLSSGSWSESPPVCRLIQCEALPALINGSIAYDMVMDPEFGLMTRANHTCNPGYELDGPMIRICIVNPDNSEDPTGVWDQFAPTCRPICEELPAILNMMITYSAPGSPNYNIGTVANHTCISGYALVGNMMRRCVDSLTWSGQPPSCEPIECPELDPLVNGNIMYAVDMTADFMLMTRANHTCNRGYELVGPPVRTCIVNPNNPNHPDGVWDLTAPTCELILCPQLPSILNGVIIYSDTIPPQYDIDSTATYQCDPGYCLSERVERVCQIDRTWSGSAPQCELITCPLLNVTENGQVTYSDTTRRVGTIATYTCTTPYQLIGTMQRTCLSPNTPTCEDGIWSGSEPLCRITNTVNDTVTGDPLMTVPLNIVDKSALNVTDDEIVNLCFELHGTHDAFFNLVSDGCVSVNAHYNRVLPNDPREDINIIDGIYVRASDNAGVCRNIEVSLDRTTSGCAAFVDDVSISSMYQSQGISVRVYSNRVRVMVPNCDDLDLVMWIFCRLNIFRSTHLTVPNTDIEAAFTAPMLRFVIARGFNLKETSHGILGQFWNVPIQVQPFNGTTRPSVTSTSSIYEITVRHPDSEVRRFTGWFWPLTWEFRSEYCLYAGNQQAGPVYEVLTPNEAVIEGAYKDYLMDDSYDFEFMFSRFENSSCSDSTL